MKLKCEEVPYYAVFCCGILVLLTDSSQRAVEKFLGTDNPEGTPCDGMYKVKSLKELSEVVVKRGEVKIKSSK